MSSNPHCHRLSNQARRTTRQIDDVELMIIRHRLERAARFALPRKAHRLIEIPLDERVLVVVWRYEGERTGSTQQRVIHWDSALLKPLTQHRLSKDIWNHLIATGIVSMLGAGATFAYSKWHFMGFLGF